jgi:hypothetical protein
MTALTVIYLKSTGHVLAAVTCAAPPTAAEPVKALVGAHLPWGGTGQVSVNVAFPVGLLAAVTVDDTWHDVSRAGAPLATPLIDPQAFQVVVDPQNKTPPKVTEFPTAPGAPTVTLNFATPDLTATLTNLATPLTAVVVLQEVTPAAQAGSILTAVPVPWSGAAVASGFISGDIWSAFVFIQGAPAGLLNKTAVP